MKDIGWVPGWYKCEGQGELFLPTSRNNKYCSNCQGKSYYRKKKTRDFFKLFSR
jgi:DnaJ-class molecular chaperone